MLTLNHMIVYEFLLLDKNTWYHITMRKQMIIIIQ